MGHRTPLVHLQRGVIRAPRPVAAEAALHLSQPSEIRQHSSVPRPVLSPANHRPTGHRRLPGPRFLFGDGHLAGQQHGPRQPPLTPEHRRSF
jgi:hypothetical protein